MLRLFILAVVLLGTLAVPSRTLAATEQDTTSQRIAAHVPDQSMWNYVASEAYWVSADIVSKMMVPEPSVASAPEQVQLDRPRRQRQLNVPATPEVRMFLRYYTAGRGRGVAIRAINRATAQRERAESIFREEGVPTELIWLALVESGWRPDARSPVGAVGIWQFMPATAERFGMAPIEGSDERMDFEKSTRAAARYLRILANRYDGDWLLAIGAYNCGEGGMDKAIERAGGVKDFWHVARRGALPRETANYVPAVLAASVFGAEPHLYDLNDRAILSMKLDG